MANIRRRLSGRAGVCLATFDLGASTLIPGAADAQMNRSPIIVIISYGHTDSPDIEKYYH